MSIARRHFMMLPDPYGDIIFFGQGSTPADGGANTTSPLVITPPASMVIGDLVIVTLTAREDDNIITLNNTGGQSWTAFTPVIQATGSGSYLRIWWCQFNGTWSANPSWNFAGTAGVPRSGVMNVFRSTSPVFLNWGQGTDTCGTPGNNATGVTNPGITTLNPSTIVLGVWFLFNISTWGAVTAGIRWIDISPAQNRNTSGADTSTCYSYVVNQVPRATGSPSRAPSTPTFGNQVMVSFYQILKT